MSRPIRNSARPAKRNYDNSRREAQVRAARRAVVTAARELFIAKGYPATTLETIAQGSDVALPTLYRWFGSKRALLKEVLDTSLVGDDEPVAFGERPAVKAALTESDPGALIDAFAAICRDVKQRVGAIHHVLSTAAVVDDDAAELLADLRQQAHTGRSRIVAALGRMGALDPALTTSEAEDIVYTCLSFEVAHVLTVERNWTDDQYERWIRRSLRLVLGPETQTGGAGRRSEPHEET